MQIRIILPPNIEASTTKNAIPTKLEIAMPDGSISPPEKVPHESLAKLDDSERVAAFSLLQWCGGKLASFLKLNKEQLSQLIEALPGKPCFFWANRTKEPIDWIGSELVGVSEFVISSSLSSSSSSSSSAAASSSSFENEESRNWIEDEEAEVERDWSYDGTPMTIDGSTHYLSISLPSREHPYYAEIRELLEFHRFKLEPSNRRWWLRDRHKTLNFLGEFWGDLEDRYHAEFTENFSSRTESLRDARISTNVEEEKDGYAIDVSIKAGSASDQEINQSLNTGSHYIEKDDKIFLLKKNRLDQLHKLERSLTDSLEAPLLHNGRYKIPFAKAPQAEEDLASLNPNFKPPATWRARSEALKDLSRLKAPSLPEGLEKTLRPYQKIGVSWLYHLFQHKLGGILADEMGLGKTLQALALLACLKSKPNRTKSVPRLRQRGFSQISASIETSLVVCPASLVENWRREAEKFCPELKVFVNHGSQRIKDPTDFLAYDLIVTSYGTLLRDESLFSSQEFLCVIGDEAQHIKNRRTRNAKAIASLQTNGRILLTGTPVENSIQDLMSLLDFIMPGGWKSIPTGARGEERRWHEKRIQEQAAPYILRRSKRSVAPELPEKIEQVVYLQMTPEQKSVYEKTRRAAENEISDLERKGASEGAIRMKTLTQLLRLRQVCCDPRLVDKQADADTSSKLASFLEILQEAMDGDHRILVFSQFVSILSLLKEELDAQEIPYCYIDGSTRNRMAEVDRFNDDDDIPLFLISLKAGGTGLNLTAADTVVHFDPWWNPAVEAQATDRAHRIGQTRVVTSYKLIVADSVEEKVLQLQQSKRKLLEDIFEASEAVNAKISLEDLKSLI